MPAQTVGEWFCLRNRDHFAINPREDAAFYFGRKELAETIRKHIKRSFVFGKPPKMLLWGDWGVGKTHTVCNIRYYLENNQADFPSAVFFVEFGNVMKKSKFDIVHQKMLDALGKERVCSLLQRFAAMHPGTPLVDVLHQTIDSSDMITSIVTLTISPIQSVQSATGWEWLLGLDLDATRLQNLGVSRSLTDSSDLVAVERFIGRLFWEVDHKRLIFILDEARKLESIADPDSEQNWIDAWKDLADDMNVEVGFFVSGSFRREEDIPTVLADEQITNRLGTESIVELPLFTRLSAEEFLRDLLSGLIDAECASACKRELAKSGIKEELDPYPFTPDAFQLFVDYVSRVTDEAAPRIILQKLDNLAFDAMERGKKYVNVELLNALGIS
jgi:hypothetical protein